MLFIEVNVMGKVSTVFGNKLVQIRTDLGISQEELAFKCNMHSAHMGQLERGEKSPTLETLQKIADGLCITVSDLLNFDSALPANKLDSKTNKIIALTQNRTDAEKAKIYNMIKILINNHSE